MLWAPLLALVMQVQCQSLLTSKGSLLLTVSDNNDVVVQRGMRNFSLTQLADALASTAAAVGTSYEGRIVNLARR
eukprot:m.125676 g.125676  ORF g.125676 m.125676 type:complete len:75 (-) comp9380_c1_seq3:1605-1829(-)